MVVNVNLAWNFLYIKLFNYIFNFLVSGTTGGGNNLLNVSGGHGKTFTTDTEEDETVDFLLKSAMTVPKGQPPKKRTKKYGERKSCNFILKIYFVLLLTNLFFFSHFF